MSAGCSVSSFDEDGLGIVPSAGVGISPGEEEADLGIAGIGAQRFEGEADRLLVGPGKEGLADLVPALSEARGRARKQRG